MYTSYFNYSTRIVESRWERREFVHNWWRLNAIDRRWTPPNYGLLARSLIALQEEQVVRQRPAFVRVEALPGRPRRDGEPMRALSLALMEETVAAAVVLADPRRRDGTAYLGLLACANDEESLERLLAAAQEQAWGLGCTRLIGPVGLSPYLQTGALRDHFHLPPPLHTPYHPPYLPEVLQSSLEPIHTTRLYTHTLAPDDQTAPARGPAHLSSLDPARLAGDLLPLLAATLDSGAGFPPPDAIEANFLLRAWGRYPLAGWLAQIDQEPVGFVLLQPDVAGFVRWAKGGRPLWRRAWLAWRRGQPVRAGRVLAGGVLPAWRGRGIGAQLWAQTLVHARSQGWQTLTIGPLDPEGDAAAFLTRRGVLAQQRYSLYATEG